jgi:hypothetical protein
MLQRLFLIAPLVIAASLFAQSNPVPFVNVPLAPGSALPGGPAFTLTVNGTGFLSGATVNWSGSARPTKFVSSSQLTAQISATDIAKVGTATIAVQNPGQQGTSNIVYFPVRRPLEPVTFAPHSKFSPTQQRPNQVAIGDFNGDGNLDMAIALNEHGRDSVSVYLGDGKGNFSAPIVSTGEREICCGPLNLLAADFNGDGHLDLAISSFDGDGNDPTYTYLMMGRGDGRFVLTSAYAICTAVAAGDLNGDGYADLVTSCLSDEDLTQEVFTYLSDATGNLTLAQQLLNTGGAGGTLGDFNGDGKLDLAMGSSPQYLGEPGVSIALGNGDGTFQDPVLISTPQPSVNVYAADLNGDGILDLVTDGMCTLFGNGDGTFRSGTCSGNDMSGQPSILADFNGDGILDFAIYTGDNNPGVLSIYPGTLSGTFAAPWNYSLPLRFGNHQSPLAVGDFTNVGALGFAAPLLPSNILFVQTVASVSPTSVNFTQSGETQILLTNNLKRSLPVGNIEIEESQPPSFKIIENDCQSLLGAGESCAVLIKFTPIGSTTAKLIFNYSGIGSPQVVPLTVGAQ